MEYILNSSCSTVATFADSVSASTACSLLPGFTLVGFVPEEIPRAGKPYSFMRAVVLHQDMHSLVLSCLPLTEAACDSSVAVGVLSRAQL